MGKGQRETRYYTSYEEDFVASRNQNTKIPGRYKWLHENPFYRFFAAVLYAVMFLFASFYTRFILHIHVVNKQALKSASGSGYILYGNHTQPMGDVFAPATYAAPKRMYAVASPSNLGIPVIGKLLPMLGALVTPDTLADMRKFMKAMETHLKKGRCIVIYPEAHVWPYCTFIRPFADTAFRFPVTYHVPCYCMTTTYSHPATRFTNKPGITVYIDGPFYAGKGEKPKEAQKRLHDEIYACMCRRSRLSDYEYIRYEKREEQ